MNIIFLIDRLKSYFQVNTLTELAEKLGVSITNISNWKSRNTMDWELIFTKCEKADFNWLLRDDSGDSVKYHAKTEPGKDIKFNVIKADPNEPNIDLIRKVLQYRDEKIDSLNREIGKLTLENELLKKNIPSYNIAAEPKPNFNKDNT